MDGKVSIFPTKNWYQVLILYWWILAHHNSYTCHSNLWPTPYLHGFFDFVCALRSLQPNAWVCVSFVLFCAHPFRLCLVVLALLFVGLFLWHDSCCPHSDLTTCLWCTIFTCTLLHWLDFKIKGCANWFSLSAGLSVATLSPGRLPSPFSMLVMNRLLCHSFTNWTTLGNLCALTYDLHFIPYSQRDTSWVGKSNCTFWRWSSRCHLIRHKHWHSILS